MKTAIKIALIACGIGTFTANAQSLEVGKRALDVEQYENAKRIFTNLVSANAADAVNYYYLGNAYIGQENTDSAKYFYNKGLQTNAANPYNYIGAGKIDLENGNKTAAKANFDKAIALSPKDINVYLEAGRACTHASAGKKELGWAVEYLNKAAVMDAKNAEVFNALGEVYLEKNEGTNAANNYDKAVALNPKYVPAYIGTGKIFTRALNYSIAKEAFDKAISIDPNYSLTYKYLGELEFKAQKYDKAIENYKKFVSLTDNSIPTQIRFASFLFLAKDYKQAADIIKGIVAKDSSNLIVYRLLGYSSYETNDYANGLKAMNKFMNNYNPAKILGSDYEYIGKLQGKLGEDSLAVLNLKKAISLDETRTELYGNIGEAYYTKKKYKDAAAAYAQKEAAGKKLSLTDLFFLGRAQYFSGDLVNADSSFSKITTQKADFIAAWSYRAKINANLDPETKTGQAKPFYEKLIELGQADTKKNRNDLIAAYSYLGSYYYFVKDNATAKANWLKVQEIDPENAQAKQVLAQLK